MKQQSNLILVIFVISLFFILLPAASANPAPDRSQQILVLLSAECQCFYDYAGQAQAGDSSNYENVKGSFSIAVNNINRLMDEEESTVSAQLQTVLQNFAPDAASAMNTGDSCSGIYESLLEEFSNASEEIDSVNSYESCVEAGYHTDNETCFIGGTQVFDTAGNLIGYYYADCYDVNGFHPGSCWDCFYGADNSGCLARP